MIDYADDMQGLLILLRGKIQIWNHYNHPLHHLHHAPICFARVEVRHTQSYPLPIDRHKTLYQPLIPDLAIIRLSPEAHLDLRVSRKLHRVLRSSLAR